MSETTYKFCEQHPLYLYITKKTDRQRNNDTKQKIIAYKVKQKWKDNANFYNLIIHVIDDYFIVNLLKQKALGGWLILYKEYD